MSLDTVFQNLTPDELQKADAWIQRLREAETPRVQETLRVLNSQEFYFGMSRTRHRFAVIVAGSSIDIKDYSDIDLFMLPQEFNPEKISKQGINAIIEGQLEGNLPEMAFYLEYGPVTATDGPYKGEVLARGLGAVVTISLFYSLTGFGERRPNRSDDLLEPKEPMRAEQLIQYNREQGSKFLVLSRQYPIKT